MMKMITELNKSTLAGVLIAFAGVIYCGCQDVRVGAALFSVGLISIILLGAKLFTGKVGYIKSLTDVRDCLFILGGNIVAATIVGVIYYFCMSPVDMSIKLSKTPLQFLFGGILCGVCIYIAVECFSACKNILCVILPVMAFILGGGEHCIADVFYFAAAGEFSIKAISYIFIAVIGNSVGSLLIRFLQVTGKTLLCRLLYGKGKNNEDNN